VKIFDRTIHCGLQWAVGAALAVTAAVSGMGAAAADTPTDVLGPITDAAAAAPLAASLSNGYFPAAIPYSADPANPFAPVYTIEPVGAPEVSVTTASGEVDGTQAFSVDALGIPVGTFTGQFDYSRRSQARPSFSATPTVTSSSRLTPPAHPFPKAPAFCSTNSGSASATSSSPQKTPPTPPTQSVTSCSHPTATSTSAPSSKH
jgi:hypothetical protein